jgi:hypothetical protein
MMPGRDRSGTIRIPQSRLPITPPITPISSIGKINRHCRRSLIAPVYQRRGTHLATDTSAFYLPAALLI